MKRNEPIKGRTGLQAVLAQQGPAAGQGCPPAAPGQSRNGDGDQGPPHAPGTARHSQGYGAAPRPSQGPQQVKQGQRGLLPAQGRGPRCSSSWAFPTGAGPVNGASQWFDPHNQQDPPFGAACCLLPTLPGCDRADRRTAASQPSPGVPLASLARLGTVLMRHYFYSRFNLLSILIRNIFSLFALAASCTFSVCGQQQLPGAPRFMLHRSHRTFL